MTTTPARLAPGELRELFLFEHLTPEQLDWVAANANVVEFPAGSDVTVEGQPAECFYVLLSGQMTMSRLVGGTEVETVRTSDRGVYSGAVQFYFGDRLEQRFSPSVRGGGRAAFL